MSKANYIQVNGGHCFICHHTWQGTTHMCAGTPTSCQANCPDSFNKGIDLGAMSHTPAPSEVEVPTPAEIIVYMLDEATRRTDLSKDGEFGMSGGVIWTHRALTTRIDEYVSRLLAAEKDRLIGELISKLPGRNNSIDDSSLDRDLDEYERGWNGYHGEAKRLLLEYREAK